MRCVPAAVRRLAGAEGARRAGSSGWQRVTPPPFLRSRLIHSPFYPALLHGAALDDRSPADRGKRCRAQRADAQLGRRRGTILVLLVVFSGNGLVGFGCLAFGAVDGVGIEPGRI